MTSGGILTWLLRQADWAVLVYFLVVNGLYAVLLASAAVEMRRHRHQVWEERSSRLLGSSLSPTISMIAPAHNEGVTVGESVRALLTLHYPNLEVVLVNDGSTDDTLDILRSEFDLVPVHPLFRKQLDSKPVRGIYRSPSNPALVVVDKVNGGKADALNAGFNVASGTLVCAMDADTLVEPDALLRMVRPFLVRDDVVAVGGTVRVANGSRVRAGRVVEPRVARTYLAGVQTVEYLRSFLLGRLGWNRLGGNLIISGAFGLFRRQAVLDAGGYLHDTVGEDMELVARLRRRGLERREFHRVDFVPDAVAWTEVPESLRALGRQRDRWHRGLADVLWQHRRLMGNPRYGLLGTVVVPYFVLVELFGPLVEAAGLLGVSVGLVFGVIDVPFAVLFFLVAYGFSLVLDALVLSLEEFGYRRYQRLSDRLLLFLWAAVGSIGYRQLTVLWRLRGLTRYMRGNTDWGTMARRGFTSPESVPAGTTDPPGPPAAPSSGG